MAENHKFGKRSLDNLATVHDQLRAVALLALKLSPHDFTVTEGVRSLERQKQLLAQKATTTLKSYHLDSKDGIIDGKGCALDFYPYFSGEVQVRAPMRYFKEIADAFKQAASDLGVKITWGGDWKSFKDGPHIQLELGK